MKEKIINIRMYVNVLLGVFVVSIVQTSFFLEIFGTRLNPSLVVTLSFGVYLALGLEYGLLCAFLGGLLLDFVTFQVIGATSLLYVTFIYFSNMVRTYVLRSFRVQLFLMMIFSVIFRYFMGYRDIFTLVTGLALDMIFLGIFYWLGAKIRERQVKSGFKVPYKNI